MSCGVKDGLYVSMIEEFSDDTRQDAHQRFQRWRHNNPAGFFLNLESGSSCLLHKVACAHHGNTKWGVDGGHSLTRKRKICASSIAVLEAWASSHGISLRRCTDCAPEDVTHDYVAFHSSQVMGYDYRTPKDDFHFTSRKPERYLRGAIGCRAWVIASTRVGSRTSYRLAGMFSPSTIARENGKFGIWGQGVPLDPPLEVTTLPWFEELRREQNNFSFGFSRIRSANVIAELQRLLRSDASDVVIQPDEISGSTQYIEGATCQVSVNRYERNPRAREQCIQHHGCRCSVCGFDFSVVYGELGVGFIQVHHLRPLSEIAKEYEVDPVADLCPICPNCHAMIHRSTETMTIEKLRELVLARKSTGQT